MRRRCSSLNTIRWSVHSRRVDRAILVETVRIEGKPLQRYLAYLGSVQVDRRDRPRFWYDVTRKLDQCRLSREERKQINASFSLRGGPNFLVLVVHRIVP